MSMPHLPLIRESKFKQLPEVVDCHASAQPFQCSGLRKYASLDSKSASLMYSVSEFVDRRDDYMTRTRSLKENMWAPITWKHEVPKSVASLKYTASDLVDGPGYYMTPTRYLEENMSNKWHELHAGSSKWEHLLDPLHPWLRREIVKYGEFAQATYDAFNNDSGNCQCERHKLFDELHLTKHGYKVTKYIYAMSHVGGLHYLERSQFTQTWSKDSNWIGFVAVSTDDESQRIGRRDIVMAWRGTVAVSEWVLDFEAKLQHIGEGDVMVEYGFHKIYSSKSESTRYNKFSASEQVMEEVKNLVKFYGERGEEVSFTITGHSLGGALALLNAYEAAATLPDLPITVISFGAPQVGNIAFRDKIDEMKVRTLRIVVKQDIVPTLPEKFMSTKILQRLLSLTGTRKWVYTHVGEELALDMTSSPYLKRKFSYKDCHNLEIYLHLLDGFHREDSSFQKGARRDIALVNKNSGMLIEELGIPENWYQVPNKGLMIFNSTSGRWVKRSRVDQEDIFSSI